MLKTHFLTDDVRVALIRTGVRNNLISNAMRLLFASLMFFALSAGAQTEHPHPPPRPLVEPHIARHYPNDQNGDHIEDALLEKAQHATTPAKQNEMVRVELIFTEPVTQGQIDTFLAQGGVIDHVFHSISYGWTGKIPLSKVASLPTLLGDTLTLVQEAKLMQWHLDKATQTGRVRPIWATSFNNGTGYDGSTNITICVMDSGVDGTHPDLSGREVFWKDYSPSAHSTAVDYDGHGSHVAGIAFGSGSMSGTNTSSFTYTTIGDLTGYPSNQFNPFSITLGTGSTTLTSWAKWNGGGTAKLIFAYHTPGSVGYTTFVSSSAGNSPLTLSTTLTPSASRVYAVGLVTQGTTNVTTYVISNSVSSYPAIGDGFAKLRGVAPGCNWAGAKVQADTDPGPYDSYAESALDDMVTNRITDKIKVINMSFGSTTTDATLRQYVNNTVNNGIVVVCSAGNNGQQSSESAREITDPGTAAYAITVAAADDGNQLTDYSSVGPTNGLSTTSGQEQDYKPDLMAPGGSDYYTDVLSIDSNDGDADNAFSDVNPNDYRPLEGTSMASPFVAGCAALVIDAMEANGYTWDFTSSTMPMTVKMLLAATATESNTNRENNASNPTLQRTATGPVTFPVGKDPYEGYGMINPDAAVEAVAKTLILNVSTNDTLGGSATNRRAWARKVTLAAGQTVSFTLTNPATGDFDLYLYSLTPGTYGKPTILASSTSSGVGVNESFTYTASTNETDFIVVKNISGSGTFNLLPSSSNDNFINAFSVISTYPGTNFVFNGTVTATGNNTGYTAESGEPSEISFGGGHSAWFVWTAPYTGTAQLSMNRESVQAYSGSSVSSLTSLGDQINSSQQQFSCTAGSTYYFAVFGGGGSYTLTLSVSALTYLPLTNSTTIYSNSTGVGASSPYPSMITISGVTQSITKATCTLNSITHNNLSDLHVLLVDPTTNHPVLLMANAGQNQSVNNLTVTFNDAASTYIPSTTAPTNGSYKPANYYTSNGNLASPAPSSPYSTNLYVLTNATVNGSWLLYVDDFQNSSSSGNLNSGWSLALTFDQPPSLFIDTTGLSWTQGESATVISSSALVSDPDNTNFTGGSLTVQYTANGSVDDRLTIAVQGNGSGQINTSGTSLEYGGKLIGNFSGGSGTSPLVMTFNTVNATPAAVQALIPRIFYQNVSDNPSTATRTVQYTLNDGSGASASATTTISVTAVHVAPTLTTINTLSNAYQAQPFTNTYATLLAASDASTPYTNASLSFRVQSLSSGALTENGTNVVAGTTLLSTNGNWVWTPAGTNYGVTAAYTVEAWDGTTNSSPPVQVYVNVLSTNHAPVVAHPSGNFNLSYNGNFISYGFFSGEFSDQDTGQKLTYTGSGAPPGMTFNGGLHQLTGTPVQAGAYPFQIIATDNGTPSLSATDSFTITVLTAPLSITASNVTRSYGAANPVFTGSVIGLVYTDSITATFSCSAITNSSAGTYTIVPTISDPYNRISNYTVTTNYGTLTVTQVPLNVTPSIGTMTYGGGIPGVTFTYSGFTNGQTLATSDVTGTPGTTSSASSNSPPGNYTLSATAGTLASANYSFVFGTNTLTVTPAPLLVSGDDLYRAYGATNPVLIASYAGFVNGESITNSDVAGAPELTTGATTNSAPGVYTITNSIGTLTSTNYSFTFTNGTLTVTQAVLIVAADDATRTYGGINPTLTFGITGFANGESLATSDVAGSPVVSTLAATNSPAGEYPITTAVGTMTSTNYSFALTDGTLTVNPAPLLVTADDEARTYGAANPALTVSYSGFANGEVLATSDLTGAPSVTTGATTNSPVGTYVITNAAGTLASTNYSLTFSNGTLTVQRATLDVAIDTMTRFYGAPDPVFTYSISGFQNGETAATAGVTGSPALVTSVVSNSPPGNYSISADTTGMSAPNYLLEPALGNNGNAFVVTHAPLTITPNDASRAFDTANPSFTGVITGIANNDNITATYAATAILSSPVGSYPITAALIDPDGKLGNYSVTTNQGTLTITNNNVLPSVTITNPANGSVYAAGDIHVISAAATDSDGSVTNVEFFANATSLGHATAAPFQITWTNLYAGSYALTAQATDNQGGVSTSAVVNVTSQPYLRNATRVTSPVPQFQMNLYGGQSVMYYVQYSTNLTTWSNLATITITNGAVPVSDTNVSGVNKRRFYRAQEVPGQ